MTVATIELYILIVVCVIWVLLQDLLVVRKEKNLHQLSCKVLTQFGLNLVCCWDMVV